jgi:adhesin transport system membrane fusion protein
MTRDHESPIEGRLSTEQLVQSPRFAHRVGYTLFVVLAALTLILLLAPWQQNVLAKGRVIAFDPVRRQQVLQAPIEGRIKKWYVVEGQRVARGEDIVELEDNDPSLMLRLQQEVAAIEDRIRRTRERVESLDLQMRSLELSRENARRAAEERMAVASQNVEAATKNVLDQQAVFDQLSVNFNRQQQLRADGLISQLDLEKAEQQRKSAEAELGRRRAALRAAERAELAAQAERDKVVADADALIQSARAARATAEAEIASAERELQSALVRRDRQNAQFVKAPCDGTVLRLLANAADGGALVKAGDRLATIVPDLVDTVAELWVDGVDMPLIDVGRKVRLQFEGWPAIQFVGWPSVAVGTFGGRVRLVDPSDDGRGTFRILVEPDPDESQPWPEHRVLRPGVRANGWVLLNRVPLWKEIWRQLNSFPPTVSPPQG